MTRSFVRLALAALATAVAATPAAAQFGTHSWQMQPYCNVVTLTLTQHLPSGGATVSGFDNLCGMSDRASVVGMATGNAGGNVTLTFTIVTTPNARPVHVAAVVNLTNGNGTWTDSGGTTGTMAYNGNTAGLPLRPVPVTQLGPNVITTLELAPAAVGGGDINTSEVQARISDTCPAGQAMTGVNANGTVSCVALPTGGGGGTGTYFRAGGTLLSADLNDGQPNPVNWTHLLFNVGGGTFTPGTSAYVAPSAGLYLMTATVPVSRPTATAVPAGYCGSFFVNNTTNATDCQYFDPTLASNHPDWLSLSTTVQLAAGDSVNVRVMPTANGPASLKIGVGFQTVASFTVTKLQ